MCTLRTISQINELARQPFFGRGGARRDSVFKEQGTKKVGAKRSRFLMQRRAFKG